MKKINNHHLIISGTSRAGTTFLVQLFTELGFDTGFNNSSDYIDKIGNAGMEKEIHSLDAPYIIKNPRLCDYLDEVIEKYGIVIDHAIIPIRDLYSAAQSRRESSIRDNRGLAPYNVPGGLWDTNKPEDQEIILAIKFYNLLYAITKHQIPVTFLFYPLFLTDTDYLYNKLHFLFKSIEYSNYLSSFNKISKPNLIHSYVNTDSLQNNHHNPDIIKNMVSALMDENNTDLNLQRNSDNFLFNFLQLKIEELAIKNKKILELENQCSDYKMQIISQKNQIEQIKKSKSWKIVEFLKKIRRIF